MNIKDCQEIRLAIKIVLYAAINTRQKKKLISTPANPIIILIRTFLNHLFNLQVYFSL